MPLPTTDGPTAPLAADGPLLRGLLDDASLFPPAALPLAQALAAHRRHRRSPYAAAVGPFLVAGSSVADLVAVLEEDDPAEPLDVVLVARPGADPAVLTAAHDALRDHPAVRVVGAELGWEDGWRDLGLDDLTLALEVPRGERHGAALADVADGVREGRRVLAKFRTGPTATWAWPDEDELAAVLVATVGAGLPLKLTGGLHHAVRGTYDVDGVAEENHGVLDVLLATAAALSGAGADEVAGLLRLRDAAALAELVGAWPDATGVAVRRALVSYGCCTVTDPLGELAVLGLTARP